MAEGRKVGPDVMFSGFRQQLPELIKIGGINAMRLQEALEQARKGRMHILEIMADAIAEPRRGLRAPRPVPVVDAVQVLLEDLALVQRPLDPLTQDSCVFYEDHTVISAQGGAVVFDVDAGNEFFPPTTFQMVNVHSDAGAPNVVPGELKCRFNFRYSTVWTHEQLQARVESLLKELQIDYELRWKVAGKPFLTKRGALTTAIQRAVKEHTGLDPEMSTSGGTSDGRFIAPYGIDVVELGPINESIHKVNEIVSVDDLERLERIYFRIAELLLVEG